MRIILLSLAVFYLLIPVAAAQETATKTYRMTLEECVNYAIINSYGRESIRLNEESRDIGYEQSRLERLPGLNASISENMSHTEGSNATWKGDYGVETNIVVSQGGSISNTIEYNRLYSEQAVYQTYQYDNGLVVSILQTFLSILSNDELMKYQMFVMHASDEQMKQGRIKYGAGMILESDYLLLRAQYASDSNNIVQTRVRIENDLLTLKGLLSMDMYSDLQIVPPDTTVMSALAVLPPQDYAAQRALETMPDIDIAKYNVDIAETNLKLSKSGFFPTVSLGAGVSTGHLRNFRNYGTQLSDRFSQQAGLTVSIPIFNRGRVKAGMEQSKIVLRQAELDARQTELNILETVLQQYKNVMASYAGFETNRIREDAYRRSFEAYGAQFNAGAITAVELLQQQNNYISVLNDYLQSKYSFIFDRKVLDVYMGEKISM